MFLGSTLRSRHATDSGLHDEQWNIPGPPGRALWYHFHGPPRAAVRIHQLALKPRASTTGPGPRPAATTPRHIVVVHILFWGLPHEPGAFKGNTTKVWNPHRDARCCRREELRAREFGREGDCERGSVLVSGSGCIDMRLVPWWPWRMATRLVLDAAS
jgi:hypothetical protein